MIKIKRPNKKVAIITVVVLACAGIGGYALWQKHTNDDRKASGKTTNIGGINYGPPTDEDKKETEQHKKDLQQQNESQSSSASSNSSGLKQASVVITYASSSEVRGYVGNAFEDGGICTATFTKDSSKVTATSSGFMDVNKTTCTPIAINQGRLTSGSWNVVLSYRSSNYSGSSASQIINVP
jgi:hypothetical protein